MVEWRSSSASQQINTCELTATLCYTWTLLHMNTPCLKKYITYLIFYNLKKLEPIIIIFGIQYPNIRGFSKNL